MILSTHRGAAQYRRLPRDCPWPSTAFDRLTTVQALWLRVDDCNAGGEGSGTNTARRESQPTCPTQAADRAEPSWRRCREEAPERASQRMAPTRPVEQRVRNSLSAFRRAKGAGGSAADVPSTFRVAPSKPTRFQVGLMRRDEERLRDERVGEAMRSRQAPKNLRRKSADCLEERPLGQPAVQASTSSPRHARRRAGAGQPKLSARLECLAVLC